MERDERNIYIRLGIIIAVWLIAEIILLTRNANASESAKNVPYSASDSSGEYFIAEEYEAAKTGQIRENSASGMPCDNPEQFERWLEAYEQEESEETTSQSAPAEEVESDKEDAQTVEKSEHASEVETTAQRSIPTYCVGEDVLNPELQAYLYQRLADHQIEWFMPYAVMMAYQESHFDCTAVNQSNGIDCGLFQFRAPYYEGQDIFNPYEQIDIFTEQMANRANSGRTVSEMISAHNMSDYGNYNQTYVNQVMAHSENLREVK